MNRDRPDPADEHAIVSADLAWYANGTLTPEREARVVAHVADCALCRHDLSALESMAQNLRQQDVIQRSPAPGLARVSARIDAYEAKRTRALAWGQALGPALRHLRGFALPAAIAVQSIIILALVLRPTPQPFDAPDAPARYRTLTAPVVLGAPGVELRLVFDDRTSFADVRALLGRIDGELVAGPGASGVLTVRLHAIDDDASRRALEIARSDPAVVFAELTGAMRPVDTDSGASE